MAIPDKATCEVRIDGAWRPVGFAEAHARYSSAIKRCPVCHGRVAIHVNSIVQSGLWLQHCRAHDGCSLMPVRFTGEVTPHPQALA